MVNIPTPINETAKSRAAERRNKLIRQALSHKTIDRNSRLFFTANRSGKYFEYVLGKELAEEVLKAIS